MKKQDIQETIKFSAANQKYKVKVKRLLLNISLIVLSTMAIIAIVVGVAFAKGVF